MGEINRLQLESREVARGRTVLGTAGIAAREQLESNRRVGQNAVVASGLALQAVEQGRSSIKEATEVLKNIDEEFGKARRATAAIKLVQDATFEMDRRAAELAQNPNVDALNLPNVTDSAIMDIRNKAVTAGAQLGQREQAYVMNKLGSVRNSRVATARATGFTRETDEQKAEYLRRVNEWTKQMYAEGTPESQRNEIFNDIMVYTEAMRFYLGDELTERLKDKAQFGRQSNEFTRVYLDNPKAALDLKHELLAGMSPVDQAVLIGKAESLLRASHAEVRQARLDDLARIQDKNDERMRKAIQAEASGQSQASILSDLQNEIVQDRELVDSYLLYERRVRQTDRFLKEEGEEMPSDPEVRAHLLARARNRDWASQEDVEADTFDMARSQSGRFQGLNHTDALAVQDAYRLAATQELSRDQPRVNRQAKIMNSTLIRMFARKNIDGKVNANDVSQAAAATNVWLELVRKKREAGTLGDLETEAMDFMRSRMPQFRANLVGKKLSNFYGPGITPTDPALPDDFRREVIMMQMMIDDANAQTAEQTRKTLEFELQRTQQEQQRLRQERVQQVGIETVKQEEARVEREEQRQIRQRGIDQNIEILAGTIPERERDDPRFRLVDGDVVAVDEDAPIRFVAGEERAIARPSPVYRYVKGQLVDVSEDLTFAERRAITIEDQFDLLHGDQVANWSAETIARKKAVIGRRIDEKVRRAERRLMEEDKLKPFQEAAKKRREDRRKERATKKGIEASTTRIKELTEQLKQLTQPEVPE